MTDIVLSIVDDEDITIEASYHSSPNGSPNGEVQYFIVSVEEKLSTARTNIHLIRNLLEKLGHTVGYESET